MEKLTFDHHPDDLPERYVMAGKGNCLEPEIMDGQKLLFSRTEPYAAGDFVLLFKKREFTLPGDHQLTIKRLLSAPAADFWRVTDGPAKPDEEVIVEALNPPQTLILMASMILGIHKCLGPLPPGAATTKVSDEWIKQQADKRRQEPGR